MKKTIVHICRFLQTHYRLSTFIIILLFVISCPALIYAKIRILTIPLFGFSLVSFFRMLTYKVGKIPIIMIDATWNVYSLKYSGEELEEKYKAMSLKRASIYFLCSLTSFFVWLPLEIIASFV